jgi:predicted protein tyrosine phosphatase
LKVTEKILFVCTANVDRSRTAEDLLRDRTGFQVRSAGTWEWAERKISARDIEWADRIFAMEGHHREAILTISPGAKDKIAVLDIPDVYRRGDPELVALLKERLLEHGVAV